MTTRWLVLSLLALTAATCARKQPRMLRPTAPPVQTWGTLHEVMHEGRVGPKVTLRDVLRPHLYAVGALADLDGEVVVVNGTAYVARAEDASAVVSPAPEATAATLLVAAAVPSWIEVPLPLGAPSGRDLDSVVEAAAIKAGLDPDQPFPFLVTGRVEASWHVLRGHQDHAAGGEHDAHMRNAITGRLVGQPVTVVGFFSRHHEGVFTHMGQRTHLHVLSDDGAAMGHVDEIAVPSGAALKLPGGL